MATTKKTATKAAAATKASKKKAASKAAPAPAANGLTENARKVLTALGKAKQPLTRADLRAATGIQRGFSKLLGTATKGVQPDSLEGRGLVKSTAPADGEGRALTYTITAAGKRALEAK